MASGGSIYPPGFNPPPGNNQGIGLNTGGLSIGNTGFNPPSPSLPPYNPMLPPRPTPRPISYSNINQMSQGAHAAPRYDPGRSYRRPIHISRRYRSRRCRPVVHIIESDSCSIISTCSSDSCCSLPRCPPVQQQQIILLPIEYPPTQSQSIVLQPLNPVPQQIRAGPIQYV